MDEIVTINVSVDLSQGKNKKYDLAKREISPEKLSQHAFSFAFGFREIIDLITDPQKIDQIMNCEQVATILSLVDEILLKSLIYEEMEQEELKKYITEHDLIKLFRMIDETEQEAIWKEYNTYNVKRIGKEEFINEVKEIKDTFIQFRYCFEMKGFALKQRFLKEFTNALLHYCKEKRTIRLTGGQ